MHHFSLNICVTLKVESYKTGLLNQQFLDSSFLEILKKYVYSALLIPNLWFISLILGLYSFGRKSILLLIHIHFSEEKKSSILLLVLFDAFLYGS